MGNKYINLFLSEPRFGMRVILLCAVVFALMLSSKQFSSRLESFVTAQNELALVNLIPEMELEVKDIEAANAAKMSVAASNSDNKEKEVDVASLITGIFIQGDSPIVLVGDDFLKEGDAIGQFIISSITEHKVILKDKVTSLTKEVTFE
jgi:hypothetical protein